MHLSLFLIFFLLSFWQSPYTTRQIRHIIAAFNCNIRPPSRHAVHLAHRVVAASVAQLGWSRDTIHCIPTYIAYYVTLSFVPCNDYCLRRRLLITDFYRDPFCWFVERQYWSFSIINTKLYSRASCCIRLLDSTTEPVRYD